MTQLPSATATPNATNNPQFWVVNKLTDDTFSLRKCSNSSCSSVADVSSTSWGNYTANSATAACTTVGCTYLTFQRDSDNAWRTWLLNTNNCVTERVGADAYTDAAPSTSLVGPKYEPVGGVSGIRASTCRPSSRCRATRPCFTARSTP